MPHGEKEWLTASGGDYFHCQSPWRKQVHCSKKYDAYKRHQTGDGGANGEYVSTMVSLDTINMALVVQRAIKDVPELAVILQEADDMLMTSSPFFYISNLATLANKIKNPADLQWAMSMMLDGILQQPDLIWTCRALIGILDQFQFKQQLKNEFLSKVMEDLDLDTAEKKQIRECLGSVASMRQSLGYKTGLKMQTEPYKMASFLTGVSEPGERLFKMINDWVYTAVHDDAIANHISQKRTAKDVVKLPPIGDAIKEIAEQVEEQREAAQAKEAAEKEHADEENADGSVAHPPGASDNPSAKKKVVVPPQPPRNEDGQFLGYKEDGSEIRSKGMAADAINTVNAELKDAAFIVQRDCTFLVVDNNCSEDALADMLRGSKAIGKCADKRTAVIYETGSSGQASCNPKNNAPPFRKEHFEKCIRGALNSRCSLSCEKATEISGKDTFYVWDSNKPRNHTQMLSAFSNNKAKMTMAEPKTLLCVWGSDSLSGRMSRSKRGFACRHTKESEGVLVVSRDVFGLDLDVKDRKYHTGNNMSGNIGFIQHLPQNSHEEFRATPENKARIFGAENTIPMSGSQYVPASDDGPASESGKLEPVFFHGLTEKLAIEMIWSYGWERILCCTAGNGCFAVAGCIFRTPGVYCCMSESHLTLVKQHVINRIFQLKQTRECTSLYNPALVTAITGEDPEPKKKTNDGKKGDEPPATPTTKKAKSAEPATGAKPGKPLAKTGRQRQPPKKKKKGADGTAIKSDENSDSGMWSSEDE